LPLALVEMLIQPRHVPEIDAQLFRPLRHGVTEAGGAEEEQTGSQSAAQRSSHGCFSNPGSKDNRSSQTCWFPTASTTAREAGEHGMEEEGIPEPTRQPSGSGRGQPRRGRQWERSV